MDLLGAPVNELEVDSRGIGVMSESDSSKKKANKAEPPSQMFLFSVCFCFYLLFGSGVSMTKGIKPFSKTDFKVFILFCHLT